METNDNNILNNLRANLKKIIGLYQAQKELNLELKGKTTELINNIEVLKKENEDYKIKYGEVDLAKAFIGASQTSHDAKIKVNRIVREIDKCIALLNK